ncbi:Alpha/Beta hydrolase protein [Parasitella parasitica]|nr:Alpha/Beta hydrolase protein [Parasitella parasitica]
MNQLRVALHKLPPGATIKFLRKVYSLPSPAARLLLHDLVKPRSSHKSWIHKVPWNGDWSGCWIGENVRKLDKISLMKRINDCDIVLFNVHGGGFRIGTCTMFMDTWIEWIKVLKHSYGMEAIIMSVDHRLAPEYKFPSPVEDIVRAYEHLTRTLNIDTQKIIVTGDSSGASLILEMLFITHDPSMFEIVTDDDPNNEDQNIPKLNQLPRPAGAMFSSPLVTDQTKSDSWKTNVKYDYISQYTAKIIKKDYFEPPEPNAPPDANQVLGIANLKTGFKEFLPENVLMFVGEKETLLDDALDLAMKAENDGVIWEVVLENCVHDWFCLREVVKDKRVLNRADITFADFCYRCVRGIRPKSATRPLKVENESYYNQASSSMSYSSTSRSFSDYSSMRRSSEGLEAVIEEEDEEVAAEAAKYYEEMSSNSSDSSSTDLELPLSTASFKKQLHIKDIVENGDGKQKPETVFV